MVKIDREKILKAAVGSARLEGYKGPLKTAKEKGADARRAEGLCCRNYFEVSEAQMELLSGSDAEEARDKLRVSYRVSAV